MIPGPSIFQRTRRPINLLAGAIFLSLTLVYGSAYVRDMLKTSLTQSRNQMDAHQQDLTQKQLDLSNIKTHIAQFGVLREQGLVGTADREGWVEQLGVNREQLHLADTLSYLLKPPQAVADAATLEPEAMTLRRTRFSRCDAARPGFRVARHHRAGTAEFAALLPGTG